MRSAAPSSETSANRARSRAAARITQQLARTLFLSNRKSYGRKAREALLAMLIEGQLTKQQILELYLNRIFLGAGIYGVEAMSQRVFGKPAKNLSMAESALIAGLARAPAALSPWSNLDGAIRRSHVVLARMREGGFITADTRSATRARRGSACGPIAATVMAGTAMRRRTFGSASATSSAATTRRTGAWIPRSSCRSRTPPSVPVENGLRRTGKPALQAALVAMDPATGNVLALVGGRDYQQSAFNRASRSRRQPGSAFKPFVFAAALERGLSPVSILHGLNRIQPQGPDEWTPRNVSDDAPDDSDAASGADRIEQSRGHLLQQQVGTRRVLRLAHGRAWRIFPTSLRWRWAPGW